VLENVVAEIQVATTFFLVSGGMCRDGNCHVRVRILVRHCPGTDAAREEAGRIKPVILGVLLARFLGTAVTSKGEARGEAGRSSLVVLGILFAHHPKGTSVARNEAAGDEAGRSLLVVLGILLACPTGTSFTEGLHAWLGQQICCRQWGAESGRRSAATCDVAHAAGVSGAGAGGAATHQSARAKLQEV
jgi:hypothetical protein